MKKLLLLLALAASSPAMAYDTGSMSCDDIGQFAAATVTGKENGRTYSQQIQSINNSVPPEFSTEREILITITRDIYKAQWAAHFSPDGAFAGFKADCMANGGN